MRVEQLDHLVLTVADIDRTVAFYRDVLGMEAVTFGEGRRALRFGDSKINLHPAGHEYQPKAARPTPGSADLCLLIDSDITNVLAELSRRDIAIEAGPVERTGARGPITSVYIRDPDANLIELARYSPSQTS